MNTLTRDSVPAGAPIAQDEGAVASLTRLSETAIAICAKYWRSDAKGPSKTCCHGCPIATQCGAAAGGTLESISSHNAAVNAAAEKAAQAELKRVDG